MNEINQNQDTYLLKNVLLETGFLYDKEEVVATKTALFDIQIESNKIKSIESAQSTTNGKAFDVKGKLALPPFRDMHIHLDKTLYGLPWKAVFPKNRTVKDMIAKEQVIIPELLKTSVERAEKLIGLLQGYGTNFARTHFNVDPTSGTKSLEHLLQALEHLKYSFAAELVAFPQHGLFYTESAKLMEEVAKWGQVDFIGGLDPFSIDGSIEKPMDLTVQLALDNNKGIDIHLHEGGESGVKTIHYLIDRVLENPALQGRTFISHAFALGYMPKKDLEYTAERLAAAKVGICSSVPFRNMLMPFPELKNAGVEVFVGNDNVQDHWGTFGSGNMLQKSNLAAQLYGYETELDLSRCLRYATNGKTPLDDQGNLEWPKVGDDASLLLVDASCSAEAVSRISTIYGLIHQGNVVKWNNSYQA
ncbi:amidohydrolase [Sphingobacterium sp.]|uniref:amidohydrolase n=1 Tax=Sphingobacterium sp. TaxID=341027 RepID=UPI00289DFE36|nr:amidohydrolase [Sphingobacterium sp.]